MRNISANGCLLDIPYPPVKVSGKNPKYARLLSHDLGGIVSEMTAITQYFYQHIVIEKADPELSSTLECISKVEMKHLEMIGELIELLGGDPRIGSAGRNGIIYWSGKYPLYSRNINTILVKDIEAERNAIASYTERIRQIEDSDIDKVLKRIILDEEHHIKIFKYFLDSNQ